jgi:hypothetical protein
MKSRISILVFFLLPLSLFSQKVNVGVITSGNKGLTEWVILDEQNLTVVSGNNYACIDSLFFTLESDRKYFLRISVSENYETDVNLCSLWLDGEPTLFINPEIGPGDHLFPFFTGVRARNAKITGGTDASISDYPWQVYYVSDKYLCGASIIDENWVVTAAHCTKNISGGSTPASAMWIKVGATSPTNTLAGKKYNISQVIVHESYNSTSLENDIALLHVIGPISFPNAVPVKLVSGRDVSEGVIAPGVMSWVTGWGLTQVSPNEVFPIKLQKVQLPVVSNAVAAVVWGPIPSTDIMAGYRNGNKDACNGDSGGPLVVPVFGEYKLAGIVSWGSQACDNYGAYTSVSSFESWIRTKTGIAVDFTPPAPVGDTLICQGVPFSLYSVSAVPAATAYSWQIFPSGAGIVSGNSESATITWDANYTGLTTVVLRVTINNKVSDWSKIIVNIVKNTKLLSQSMDTTLCADKQVTLSTEAEGFKLNYKWYKDNQLVQSGVSWLYDIPSTTTDNSGTYFCNISGSCGTVNSNPVTLTVLPLTDINTFSPDIQADFGSDVTLEVNASGHNLSYQWQKDTSMISNSDTSKLYLTNVNATDIGLYCTTVTGTCGIEKSNNTYVYVRREVTSGGHEVFVWPTITRGEFTVALSDNELYTIQIFNTMGQLLKKKTGCSYQTIMDIGTMPKGFYIINIFNSTFRKSVKLIKQ